ncbi:MAG TPA: hypothetical protein VF606_10655, partial [Geminicoccaceae bacterium]
MPRFASFAASALLGAALAAIAFVGRGGFDLDRMTYVEVGEVAAAALLVAFAAVRGRRGRLDGGLTLLAFGGLALLCALSTLWSVAPDQTWITTNLTIGYVAVFAGAAAIARLLPDGAAIVLRGLLVAVSVVVGYALITRVFPGLAEDEVFARLG